MGKETKIAWTDHTFQPWWGCAKVSPGCKHCYADEFDHRLGFNHWGAEAPRRFFGDNHWSEPIKWNAKAKGAGVRRRVFCSSMADVFEDRPDLMPHRRRLWALIRNTPSLDWLLLTKRPENLGVMLPWYRAIPPKPAVELGEDPWPNVWIGTTVENQDYAAPRLDALCAIDAVVRFVSVEPQIGPVDLRKWLEIDRVVDGGRWVRSGFRPEIDWLIVGGESGTKARPFHVEWATYLVEQARAAGIAPFVKQLGDAAFDIGAAGELVQLRGLAPKGGLLEQFPEHLRIRDYPSVRTAI
jgi:protein gp37